MINAVALGLLLSYLGTVVVLVPEPQLTRANQHVLLQEDNQPPETFSAAEQAAVNTLLNVAGTTKSEPPSIMENVKEKMHQGFEKTTDGIGSVKESATNVYERATQGMQEKASDAYSLLPSKDEAASSVPGVDKTTDAVETVKTKLENSQQGMQEAIRDAASSVPGKGTGIDALETLKEKLENSQRSMQESIRDAVSYFAAKDSDQEPGFTENVGEVFDGVKERLSAAEEQNKKKLSWFRKKPRAEGVVLGGKVQEFCNWFAEGSYGGKDTDGGGGGEQVSGDAKESFKYLVDAAKGAIDGAREVFEKAVVARTAGGGGGVEWRERYNYLADSAKGALEGAREVFERVAAGSGRRAAGDRRARIVDWAAGRGGGNATTAVARLAEHTKERLSASLQALLRALYLATYSVIYGVTLWMTFVSGHLLALYLPRHQLALLQSKLFPVYLRLISFGLALCFAIHAFLHPLPSADPTERWQFCNFASSLAACLLNTFLVEPRATRAMFEKLKEETEGGVGQAEEEFDETTKAHVAAVDAKFKDMHAYSSSLNLLNVAGLSWHLWYLSNRIIV